MNNKSRKSPLNLSFSGCGFLGIYHIGVICAFKEHAPEVLENQMAGCSAGALAAACTMSGCCLGQMCSDVLELAVRARSRTLGPLHPTFNIVDIIRNSLRRILPPNAHDICSGRLSISLTRWKDNKNVMIDRYDTREELIQVLICSSFVPYWSGMIPYKFRDEYYWDGGLTNNNPILNENTITISPFAGESDICPRDESGSFYSLDFRGTDILCTQENLFRVTRALFPPSLTVLKQVCWRGYIDGLKFMQTRNMIKSSHLSPKTSISSVLGDDYTEPTNDEEEELANGGIDEDVTEMYEKTNDESEEDDEGYSDDGQDSSCDGTQAEYSRFCEKVSRNKELPTPLFAVFADARQKVEGSPGSYFTRSKIYKIWSFMTLPVTLPIDFTYAVTRRVLGGFRPDVPSNETIGHRAMNYVWSFFGDENNEKYCYHVNDCECTGNHRPSSTSSSRRRRSRVKRKTNVAQSLATSSSQSDFPTDDEDQLTNDLSQPDLVASIINDEYCQQQAESSTVPIPFFGRDDPHSNVENNQLPTSNLEKNVLFN